MVNWWCWSFITRSKRGILGKGIYRKLTKKDNGASGMDILPYFLTLRWEAVSHNSCRDLSLILSSSYDLCGVSHVFPVSMRVSSHLPKLVTLNCHCVWKSVWMLVCMVPGDELISHSGCIFLPRFQCSSDRFWIHRDSYHNKKLTGKKILKKHFLSISLDLAEL